MSIGKKIAKLRKENNMTQKHLAEELCISYQAVSKWENELSSPDFDTVIKISNLFNVSLDYFKQDKQEEITKDEVVSKDQEDFVKREVMIDIKTKETSFFYKNIFPCLIFVVSFIFFYSLEYFSNLNKALAILLAIVLSTSLSSFFFLITRDEEVKKLFDKCLIVLYFIPDLIENYILILILIKPIVLLLSLIVCIILNIILVLYCPIRVIRLVVDKYGK